MFLLNKEVHPSIWSITLWKWRETKTAVKKERPGTKKWEKYIYNKQDQTQWQSAIYFFYKDTKASTSIKEATQLSD